MSLKKNHVKTQIFNLCFLIYRFLADKIIIRYPSVFADADIRKRIRMTPSVSESIRRQPFF